MSDCWNSLWSGSTQFAIEASKIQEQRTRQKALTLCPPGNFFQAFLLSAECFQNQHFRKILSGIPFECQTDWILIRPDDYRARSGSNLFAKF